MDAQYFKRGITPPIIPAVGPSPFTYTNDSLAIQLVTVSGGVVTLISLDSGMGLLPAVGVAGVYVLFPTNSIQITYLASPPIVSVALQ